jgi:peptidoglycan hydrolase-like protein with peptidoglycan-binding domain
MASYLPRDRAAADGPLAPATTVITRGTLVEVTTASATLGFGPERSLESRLAGTVTALPAIGSTVGRGKPLFRIDDKPVVLFFGPLPAYRELTAGHAALPVDGPSGSPGNPSTTGDTREAPVPATKGADVKQFEQNLAALGYAGFTVDDDYTPQTAAAVRRWQKDLGLAQTGDVELGRVFYADGPVRVATHKATVGAVAAGPLLTYTGTRRLVTASLKEHDKELAKVNTKVTVSLPNGKEVPGTVVSVQTPTEDQASPGQEPTLDVVVALKDQASVNGLDDGQARVRFVVQERKDVLMVPVGALLALAEGGYGLQVINGASSQVVSVSTGLFANGNVEVSGVGIREGMVVGMAQ